jgi:hypothetical protein
MRFLKILEQAWLAAIIIAFGMGIYNAITYRDFSYHVYTPFVCGAFCILIYYNIHRQRLFVEKMKADKEKENPHPNPSPKEKG